MEYMITEEWMRTELRCGCPRACHVQHEGWLIECDQCGATWIKGAERVPTGPMFMLAA